MTNSVDRQTSLEKLTSIETTAKLLLNALVKKTDDQQLSLDGIHREELINQTKTFLSQARISIVDIANSFHLATDGFFESKSTSDDEEIETKKIYSLTTVTLDEIIQNHLTIKHLLPNYPLFHDPTPPNLLSLARQIRQVENLDELLIKIYSKIFNHEERLCCNYEGIHGKLPFPQPKRLVFDLMIRLIYNEHKKTLNDNEIKSIYSQCEKHFSSDTSSTKLRGINYEQINHINDEKQLISSLFRLIIPQDDLKNILSSKQTLSSSSSSWNENDVCIYYARPIHLLTIKQKWLEKYPVHEHQEAQKWSQCIDWFFESFLEPVKVRPSKRKTMDVSVDDKRRKSSLTLEDKLHQIDRTKFDVFEYATQYLQLLFDENNKNLPSFEQLQTLELCIQRYYWTKDFLQTWKQILENIQQIYQNDSREIYMNYLLENHSNEQEEIQRLLQLKID